MTPARADDTKPWWGASVCRARKRHPSLSELDRADHPEACRGGEWRAGRDGYLEVVAHRVGQALKLGVGE